MLDFGLAKLKGKTKLTAEAFTLGTIYYMSPEQCQGVEVDHLTDIGTVGVILYEMITSKLPFAEEYEQAVMYSIANEEPEPLARFKTGISDKLQHIVAKAFRKDTNTRYG